MRENSVKELIEYVAKSLVDHPDQVTVTEFRREQFVVIQLRVAPEDMGKVIGRQGRIAQAMRSLLKVASARQGMRATLEIA
jgi:hypothetical protein